MIRPATRSDLDSLVQLETRNFDADRLSRRSFQHLLSSANTTVLVDEEFSRLRGYTVLRFHARSSNARLYSFAVDHDYRNQGIGKALLAAAEQMARTRGVLSLRLEVGENNQTAIRLYEKSGYRRIGKYLNYYADNTDALRMTKSLVQPALVSSAA